MRKRRNWIRSPSGLLLIAQDSGAAGPYLLDEFTDANDTALASHVIAPNNTPSASWTALAGTWVISSNKAVKTSADALSFGILDSGVANCVISADVYLQLAAGISFRMTDATHGWMAELQQDGNLRIYRNTGSGWAAQGTVAAPLANGNTYTLRVTLSGNSITAAVGAYSCSTTSATYATNTKHGLYIYRNTSTIDNFRIMI